MEKIRILIADDQVITRSGLRVLLSAADELQVVGEANNGEEAIAMANAEQPDVILMDLRMPGVNGIEATRRIHRTSPHIGILILTVFEDDASVFPAIRSGARGYLLKNSEQEELVRAIRTVAAGGAVFSPGIAQKVLGYLSVPQKQPTSNLFDELTEREREILHWIARGKTNTEIASNLNLSAKTVSNYISNVLLKVHATDRAKLMLIALDAGLGQKETGSE